MAQHGVVWSAAALADMEAIAAFIARDSERYAASIVERMLEAAAALADFPERGRVVPEFSDESIREVFVYSWRLIYRVQTSIVTILTVVHQKQRFKRDPTPFHRS